MEKWEITSALLYTHPHHTNVTVVILRGKYAYTAVKEKSKVNFER